MLRIAITGKPGSGKSTVCRNVLKQLTCTFGGMTSADIREKGERMGSYHVNIEELNRIGVAAIKNAMSTDLIVIDEIAPMEFKSPEFIKAVNVALDSDKGMLIVLHQKSGHPVAQRIRREFLVYTVTPENREEVVLEVSERINRSDG
jgi:nucleoside-triphosphatase